MHQDQPQLQSYGHEGAVVAPGENGIGGVFTHGGRFVSYNLRGTLFDVTAKYQPPIQAINRGASGFVCSAWNAETNKEVAVKKITNAFDNVLIAKRTLREIKILNHLRHENVLEFKEVIPPPQKSDFKDVYIVTELMDTDLRHVIHNCDDVTEEHNIFFLYQLVKGLKYIHSANVLHRDLKPGNLLINEDCGLKIADFGLARIFSESDLMTEYVVTRWYRPPELLLSASTYTPTVDMWSVGCILAELYNHEPLFPGMNYVDQFHSIVKLMGSPADSDLSYVRSKNARKYLEQLPKCRKQPLAIKFPHLPALALDLIEKMLTYDPAKRITAEQALEHPYLAPFHDPANEPSCPTPFVMDFEEQSLSEEDIKELIYDEAVKRPVLTSSG